MCPIRRPTSTHPDSHGDARVTTVASDGPKRCVIGIRRRSAVGKMVLGSNAHRILMDAPCPVVTVRAA